MKRKSTMTYYNDTLLVEGPYSNVNSSPGSHWYGKETQCVYDAHGIPLCVVPKIYHYGKDKDLARVISSAIAKALTEVGFMFDSEAKSWSIGRPQMT